MFCPISSGTSFVLQCPGEARGRSKKEAHQHTHTKNQKTTHHTNTTTHFFNCFHLRPTWGTYVLCSNCAHFILGWPTYPGERENVGKLGPPSPQTGPAWCLQQFPFSGATDLPGVPCLDVITSPGAWYPGAFTEDDGQRQ